MIVVIVEDEPLIANRIERLIREILGQERNKIIVKNSFDEAQTYLMEHSVDLLLLDLNLHGRDGFELLKQAVSGAYHTIIISAHTDQALKAFEYGVLDFVGKPFTKERLFKAVTRFKKAEKTDFVSTKYVAVKKPGKLLLIEVDHILYIQGAGIYSEIVLESGLKELSGKTLHTLEVILPAHFIRTHKSYIINMHYVKGFSSRGGSAYQVHLSNDVILPISRMKYKEIKTQFM